ncbi:MAG: zinc carboxypeptidase [Erysipelotrichaceae bacterium]|nr:zinc carboxypeptidase [Erysipelotrichaceae bacterium]
MKTTYCFDHYFDYEEMTSMLKSLCEKHSDIMSLTSICTTVEKREVWAVELTNKKTGNGLAKPAFYIDGNTHAGEMTGSMAALHTIDVLATGYQECAEITKLLDENVIYVIPRITPDGAETYLKTPYSLRSVNRSYLKEKEGLTQEDVDNDGVLRMMRFKDPHGAWVKTDSFMRKRMPDEKEGEFYSVYAEGIVENFDGLNVKVQKPKWGLDFNRNYPFGWFCEVRQPGAGAYPLSNPENKAVVDFVLAHPNISCVATHHTSGGVILYPPGTKPEKTAHSFDMKVYKEIGKMGTSEMGYETINIFDHFMLDQANYSSGAFDDWCYENQGIYAYTIELWDLKNRIGKKEDWTNRKMDSDEEKLDTYLKTIEWVKENSPEAYKEFTPFVHPQLGEGEVGGFNYKFVVQNPPKHLLKQECEKTTKFMLRYAKVLPQINISSLKSEFISEGVYKIEAVIENKGYLPTYGSQNAKSLKIDEPVKVSLMHAKCLMGKNIEEIGDLEGFACIRSDYSYYGHISTGSAPAIQKKVEWIVEAEPGTEIKVLAFHPRAGKSLKTMML